MNYKSLMRSTDKHKTAVFWLFGLAAGVLIVVLLMDSSMLPTIAMKSFTRAYAKIL